VVAEISGAQRKARGPFPPGDESSCGPPWPKSKVTISEFALALSMQWDTPMIGLITRNCEAKIA